MAAGVQLSWLEAAACKHAMRCSPKNIFQPSQRSLCFLALLPPLVARPPLCHSSSRAGRGGEGGGGGVCPPRNVDFEKRGVSKDPSTAIEHSLAFRVIISNRYFCKMSFLTYGANNHDCTEYFSCLAPQHLLVHHTAISEPLPRHDTRTKAPHLRHARPPRVPFLSVGLVTHRAFVAELHAVVRHAEVVVVVVPAERRLKPCAQPKIASC